MVADAQRSRAPIQKLVDVVARYFVPAVIVCSILAFIGWAVFGPEPQLAHAFVAAVAVLIIACPFGQWVNSNKFQNSCRLREETLRPCIQIGPKK
jgi:hypothetical protein